MGWLRWLEAKLYLGEVLHDYGVIEERQYGIARSRISVLLCRRKGRTTLVIRQSVIAWMGFSVGYTELGREAILSLKRAVDDALMRAQ